MPDLLTVTRWYNADREANCRQDWLRQLRENQDIRHNEWDINKHAKADFGEVSGHVFDYNPYHKIADYNIGLLFAIPLKIMMLPAGEDDALNAEIAEHAMSWIRRYLSAWSQDQDAYTELWWKGFAVINTYFDAEAYDPRLISGVPVYDIIDSESIILDSTVKRLPNMKRLHRERDLLPEEVKVEYPDSDIQDFPERSKVSKDDSKYSQDKGFKVRVIETQYLEDEYVKLLPVDASQMPWALPYVTKEGMLSTLYDLAIQSGLLTREDHFLKWDKATQERLQRLGIQNMKAVSELVVRKRVRRCYRIDWIEGIDKPLIDKMLIEFKPGVKGMFTYTVIPYRVRGDSPYSYGAPFYSRELFLLWVWWQQLVMLNAKDQVKIRAAYAGIEEEVAKNIRDGGNLVALDMEIIKQVGGIQNVFTIFEHKGLDSGFFNIYEQLRYEFHDIHSAHKEMMGQPVSKTAPAAMQELVQEAGRLPQIPHQNVVLNGFSVANKKLFILLRYLTPGTQIMIRGKNGDNKYARINYPLQQDEAMSVIQSKPDQYKQYTTQLEDGQRVVNPELLPMPDADGMVMLNKIDADFDLEMQFETDSISVKRSRFGMFMEMYQAGALSTEDLLRNNPDIKQPYEVMQRLEEERMMKQKAQAYDQLELAAQSQIVQ